jgi:fumarate reductase flavoprotein subunit
MASGSTVYDVAAIGGGLAGLTAGLRAAQLGCRVIVLEQGTDELYPCNSRYAGGWFHLAFHDPTADVEWLVDRLLGMAPSDVNHALIESIARNAKRAVRWLATDGGARFIKGGPLDWHNNLLAPPRPPRPRLVWLGRGPDLLVRSLGSRLQAAGGYVARGHCVMRIEREREDYAITCRTGAGDVSVRSRALVLSDGGFAASKVELDRRVSRHAAAMLQRNAGTAEGAGIRLASDIGATLTETQSFYGHLHSPAAVIDPNLWPYPTVDYLALAGFVVNSAGHRFIDDGRDGVAVTNELARAGCEQGAFAIFDTAIWAEEGRQVRVPCNPLLEKLGGTLWRAPSLPELAAKAGIDTGRLTQTVTQFNEAVRNGRTELLPIPKTKAKIAPREVVQPPFFAVPICPGITHTMGGIAISPFGTVEDTSGETIPGLFAAGSTVGGAEGGRHSFYLGGLCKAATLGLICGEGAAQFVAAGGNQ